MRKHYFLDRNGDKKGPFSIEDLKKEVIYDDDLIWNNEIEEWTSARNLNEISDIVIVRPPKTPLEKINEKITKDNLLIRKKVFKRMLIIYLIVSYAFTLISYLKTDEFINDGLYGKQGIKMYYFSDSIFTRSLKAFNGHYTVEAGEYEERNILFFNLFFSSLLFFSLFFLPLGFLYYYINRSTHKHYEINEE